jgi:hypothetical protein
MPAFVASACSQRCAAICWYPRDLLVFLLVSEAQADRDWEQRKRATLSSAYVDGLHPVWMTRS